MISYLTDTITVVRPAQVVERGTVIDDWEHATTHQVTGCRIQSTSGGDIASSGPRRDGVLSTWRLLLPADADLVETDRVEHETIGAGRQARIEGPIAIWRSPTGSIDHREASLVFAIG